MTRRRVLVVALAAIAAAGAVTLKAATSGHAEGGRSPSAVASATPDNPSPSFGPVNVEPYVTAIRVAAADGLHVWLESDLVKRWLAGPGAFQQSVEALATEAKEPGVVGIKIADELGYHDGLNTPDKVSAFLDATASALRAAAPGKLLLVDMVIPALGCLPGSNLAPAAAEGCRTNADRHYKQLALTEVDTYLRRHDIDVLDVSTGLLNPNEYATWGVSVDQAQAAAWDEVIRRGWADLVTLQSRKALAHPGEDTADSTSAQTTLNTFVDIPIAHGAVATDIWTWRQLYQGQIYRILNPGLSPTALWTGLVARHQHGARLFTHMSPNSVEVSLTEDMSTLAQAFTDVFIASGTG